MNAIAKSTIMTASLVPMAWSGRHAEEIFYQLAVEDIRAAADLFSRYTKQTGGGDGYVSLEVSPYLANDTEAHPGGSQTAVEAGRPAQPDDQDPGHRSRASRPSPDAIAAGININVTLIFSLERYAEVMDAYLHGLEKRVAAGLPIGSIASVASFFVSRGSIQGSMRAWTRSSAQKARRPRRPPSCWERPPSPTPAWPMPISSRFLARSASRRSRPKARASSARCGPRPAPRTPAYRDVMYVEELIGPDTVDTVPPQTLVAFLDHGEVRPSI